MRFTVIDVVKSVAAATKGGKWYDKYLKAGGRWVTITDESSPLHGRHILLDGHGFVVGGRGIPKHVRDKLNGRHKDNLPGHSEVSRKDAVDQTKKELGTSEFHDSKGKWTIDHVGRNKYDEHHGNHEYSAYINHEKATGLKGGSAFGMVGGLTIHHNDTIDTLKRRIKASSGYTPDKATLEGLMNHINKLKDAYKEQDDHYKHSDKAPHQKTVDELYQLALDRAKKGETPGSDAESWRKNNMDEHEKYLTKAEQEKLREAQKHLRGNSQYDYPSKFDNDKDPHSTLSGWNKRLLNERYAHERAQEEKAKQSKHQKLLAKLDTDPDFRKLVAHAMEADKEKRSSTDVELVHRLHGYTKNGDAHRDKYGKLAEELKKHGVETFNGGSKLASLGKEYVAGGGMLPAVTPAHERKEGEIYFGDHVTNGHDRAKVTNVGTKYIHVDSGRTRQWDKDDVEHHELVPMNKDAKTDDEHADNVMRLLHNHGDVIHGHRMTLDSAVRRALFKRNGDLNYLKNSLRRRMENHPDQTGGIQKILNEIRRHELPALIQSAELYSKERADNFKKELEGLGGAPDRSKTHKDIEWKPGMNPYEKPEPAPAPAPAPKPAPKPESGEKGKGDKPPKLGYGDGATMHVPGSKDTFKHIKQLKHTHGGKWNGEQNRWEFNHDHGSDGHQALENYAKGSGLTLNLHGNGKGGDAPAPAPAPSPAPAAPEVSNEGGKKGTVTIGGNSYPHKYALKTEHGAQWDKDDKAWKVHDVAHGSDKHKAIQDFAKERGLTADHEHDEKKPSADLSGHSLSELAKYSKLPSKEALKQHFIERGHSEERAEKYAENAKAHLTGFMNLPHLVPYAEKHIEAQRKADPNYDMLRHIEHTRNEAELAHNTAELEKKRAKEEEARKKAIGSAKPLEGDVDSWSKNTPDFEAVKDHIRYHAHRRNPDYHLPDAFVQNRAADMHDALAELKRNPDLLPGVKQFLKEKEHNTRSLHGGNFDPLEHIKQAVEDSRRSLRTLTHRTQDGKTVKLDPTGGMMRGILPRGSGLQRKHYVGSQMLAVNGRMHRVPIPVNKDKFTKDHVAKYVEGAGDEAHAYIHHVLSGKANEPFHYTDRVERVKPTSKFEPFKDIPNTRSKKAYMEEAKGDMMAHGVQAVVYKDSAGTAEDRAQTAHTMATGMRAIHHLTGGKVPPVELVIGGTGSQNTLAHYRAGYRSITIDPVKGRNSFAHEYGHFLDDALHGFRGLTSMHGPITTAGTYEHTSPMHKIAREIENTETYKQNAKALDEKYKGYGPGKKFLQYARQDHEKFARFFAMWLPHEAKKQGIELPGGLGDPYENRPGSYGEKYTPEELDKIGGMVKDVLQKAGLWKGFSEMLRLLGGYKAGQRLVIRA